MSQLNLVPELSDLAASGAAAVASMAISGLGSPANSAMEQLGSQIVGKVAANYFEVSDMTGSEALGTSEKDVLVGVTRGAYSLSQKRNNNRVMMDAVKGLMCSIAGSQFATYLKKDSTTAATTA